jgi:ATP/maltotriose-dependent transcriptional regulator MalT
MRMTRYDEALQQARDTLATAERMGNKYWVCEMLASVIPGCMVRNGELDEALAIAKRGTDLALQVGAVDEASMGFMNQGQIAQLRGDFEEAIRCNEAFVTYAAATGMPLLTALSECTLGSVYTEMAGNHLSRQALVHHGKAMELMKQPTGNVMLTWLLADIGLCTLAAGKVGTAKELFETALTTPNATMHFMRPKALLGKTAAALTEGNLDLAWETFRACDEYVQARSMAHFTADVTGVGARIALERGDLRAAETFARESETAARALAQRPALFRALAQQAVVHARRGDAGESAKAAQSARAVMDDIAAGLTNDTLRAGFLAHAADALPAA